MYIITVIPLQKGGQKESLTYFSSNLVNLGDIVVVPVRSKNINAIVTSVDNVIDLKSDIKGQNFQLKKIIKIKGPSPFTEAFFEACKRMRNYTASNTGTIIKSLMPSIFLDNIENLNCKEILKNEEDNDLEKIKQEKLIFQALTEDRIAFYRTLIRESFAKKQSVFICVPTRYDIEVFYNALSKGIEQYVYYFHNEMGKKKLISKYNESIKEEHPIIIIGTGMFLSIPRYDIKTIIVENESSDSYKQYGRPYIDIRSFVEVLSSINKTKLIFGDTILRPETLERNENKELDEVASPLFRLPQAEREIIVDMREEKDESGRKKFMVLSETTIKMIEYAISNNESVLLFAVRKGLAPVTICHDCGHTLLCDSCKTPIVLYESKNSKDNSGPQRIYICNKCGRREQTEIRCPKCLSWNLTPLGVGTDRVREEIKSLFGGVNIIQIDKETTTDKEARIAIENLDKKPASIIIGTEMIFSYLHNPVMHSAIVSIDGLLSIPSFNMTQKIIHIIEKLQYITKRNLIIQTRIKENKTLEHILSGNVLPLFREDLREREEFGYPPFKRLIKITFTGTKPETEKARSFINQTLAQYDPQIFSAFVGKIRGEYVTNTVIKIDPTSWPLPINEKNIVNKDLLEKLLCLPPSFGINVDPEDLL